MTPVLEVADLVVRYGNIGALHGVSLRVEPGETVALVGRNGAGKTTLLQTVYGFVRAAGGTIRFQGEDITRRAAHELAALGIAYVPETRGIFRDLSVGENLRLGAFRAREREEERHKDVLGLFPVLADREGDRAGTLSGGQQQMLALARALMAGPRLLLLDEPSLGLAPMVIDSLFQALGRLAERGMTVLLVEQNVRRALSLASRGYLLNLGTIVLEASAEDILSSERLESIYLGRPGQVLRPET
jgi:branched-chain amino acid transport system ATP-binding protein